MRCAAGLWEEAQMNPEEDQLWALREFTQANGTIRHTAMEPDGGGRHHAPKGVNAHAGRLAQPLLIKGDFLEGFWGQTGKTEQS